MQSLKGSMQNSMRNFLKKSLEIDSRISLYYASDNNHFLQSGFSVISNMGSGLVFISMLLLLWIFFYDYFYQIVLFILLAEIAGLFAIIILRYATRRKRPLASRDLFWFSPWNKYSFPSHHAFRSFMVATILGIKYPISIPFLFIVAFSIGFSRIYLSKHYLTDVIAGAFLGISVGAGAYVLMQHLKWA